MTALTVPARLRPIPWRRMAWITWRQHRLMLAGVGGLLAASAAYALITGLRLHHGYAAVAACHPAGSDVCQRVANDFTGSYSRGAGLAAAFLQLVPALIGAFAGAPLLAREFETGTFRFAWTQGFGRVRWTIAKLVTLAIAVTTAAAACSVLFAWSFRPIISMRGYGYSPLYPTIFDLRGVAFAAWTLAAFAIGAFAGVLVRRAVPAMFVTLAAWVALAFATGTYLRRHYEAPVVTTKINVAPPDWLLSETLTHGGKPASLAALNGALAPVGVRAVTPSVYEPMPGPATPDNFDPIRYLVHHGFTQVTVYQPAGRFWPFQWIEAGWLLTLSLLLLATTVWLVRHRAT